MKLKIIKTVWDKEDLNYYIWYRKHWWNKWKYLKSPQNDNIIFSSCKEGCHNVLLDIIDAINNV